MITGQQLSPGMTLSLNDVLFRVDSVVKVTTPQGSPFVKTKLKNLATDQTVEKNFKLTQKLTAVSPVERMLEYLYLEGEEYLFLDIDTLDQVKVAADIVGDSIKYLKEGVELQGSSYGDRIFAIQMPPFLELMVSEVEEKEKTVHMATATKIAILETGARVEVPMFVEAGDVIKIDTKTGEYVQRV